MIPVPDKGGLKHMTEESRITFEKLMSFSLTSQLRQMDTKLKRINKPPVVHSAYNNDI